MNKPHVIARRQTYDNTTFEVWNDGYITQAFGVYYPGVRKLPLQAAFVVADEVCLYDHLEVPALLKVARKLSRKGPISPGDLRAGFASSEGVGG